MKKRQSGRTAMQMGNAPKNAIYVCAYSDELSYMRDLAKKLGRIDLCIRPVVDFQRQFWRGSKRELVIDHHVYEARFSFKELEALLRAQDYLYIQTRDKGE